MTCLLKMIRTSPLVFDKNKFRSTGVKNVFPTIVAPINMDGATTNVERRDRELRLKRIGERRNAGIEEDLSGIADSGYLPSVASTGKTGNISAASRIIMGRKQIDARSYNKVLNAVNEVQRRKFLYENRKLLQYLSTQAELAGIPVEMQEEIRRYLRLSDEERDPYSGADYRTQHIYEFVAPMLSQWRNVLTPRQEVALENELRSQLKQDYAEQIEKMTGVQPTAQVLSQLVPEFIRLNQNFTNFLQQAPAKFDASTLVQPVSKISVEAAPIKHETNTAPALFPAPVSEKPTIETEPLKLPTKPEPPSAKVGVEFKQPTPNIALPGAEKPIAPKMALRGEPIPVMPKTINDWIKRYGDDFVDYMKSLDMPEPRTMKMKAFVQQFADAVGDLTIYASFWELWETLPPAVRVDIGGKFRVKIWPPKKRTPPPPPRH